MSTADKVKRRSGFIELGRVGQEKKKANSALVTSIANGQAGLNL